MSDMDTWAAAQFADECVRIEATIRALEAAERAGTPKDAIEVLAHEAGVGEIYRSTLKRAERS